jgi:hypothetical protein
VGAQLGLRTDASGASAVWKDAVDGGAGGASGCRPRAVSNDVDKGSGRRMISIVMAIMFLYIYTSHWIVEMTENIEDIP